MASNNDSGPQTAAKSPAQVAADAKKEAEFQLVVAGAMALKKNMKNPASFELVSALRMDDGTICYEYRGTNSFNAVITSFYVLRTKTGSSSIADWNRYCANKSGIDYSYARGALKFYK